MFDIILNGGFMMIPILACSIVTISIAIDRYRYFRKYTMLHAEYAIQDDSMHITDLIDSINEKYKSCQWLKEMISSSEDAFFPLSALLYPFSISSIVIRKSISCEMLSISILLVLCGILLKKS